MRLGKFKDRFTVSGRRFKLCKVAQTCLHRFMPKVLLKTVVNHCNRILRVADIKDFAGAANGLQVENSGTISRMVATVDASLATVKLAVAARADLLIVHHGLFWNVRQPWTGSHYELFRLLTENNLAVYSAHLPLDFHPKFGNNVILCGALGLMKLSPFLWKDGQAYGLQSQTRISRAELISRLQRVTGGKTRLIPGGSEICKRIGVITGGAGDLLPTAAEEGVDTLITGEGPHWTYALAEELGMNVLYGGHYATETFGVKALAAYLSKKFHIPWKFLDHPTGL